ncbi:MAG: alpha/beta hydrolase [Clostridia bacterium]|nr:alpha/beta hydrolase [Clostridia bacterium]
MRVKNIFKLIGNIILFIFLLLIIFIMIMFIVHKGLNKKEFDSLNYNGYVNIVKAKDYDINVSSCGSENGKHKFVAISGAGVHDYSVTLRKVTDEFAQDNLIIFPERAGYGLSEDTSNAITTASVVENYRESLKNAGFEAPYILLPHSLGGAYATYWESTYPEEIEGIVFFDCTQLSDGDTFDEEDIESAPAFVDTMELYACKLGLHRLVLHKFWYYLPDNYTEEQQKLSDELDAHHGYSNAIKEEYNVINDICRDAYQSIVTNDIPKVYINASWGIRTKEEFDGNWNWMNAQCEKNGLERADFSAEDYEKLANDTIEQGTELTETELMPYLELMGNCECVNLGGDHFIFEQQPKACVEIMQEFMKRVE